MAQQNRSALRRCRGNATSRLGARMLVMVVTWLASGPRANAEPIVLSGVRTGSTPSHLGYNSGHFLPGSNTAAWWEYSGVNSSRIFSRLGWLTPDVGVPIQHQPHSRRDEPG